MNSSTPEEQFAALLAQMPSAQRETYSAQLPKKDLTKDAIILSQTVIAVQVPHLPTRAVTSQTLGVRSVVKPQQVSRDQLAVEALRAAFGNQIPEV
jgi:hypothetical protein